MKLKNKVSGSEGPQRRHSARFTFVVNIETGSEVTSLTNEDDKAGKTRRTNGGRRCFIDDDVDVTNCCPPFINFKLSEP